MAYDDLTHIYRVRGQVVPSVTRLASPHCPWWTDEARARGQAIHDFGLALDMGDRPALTDLPFEWRGYARALLGAYDELRPRWMEIETARTNVHLRYGGRRDRVGVLLASVAIVDFKTSDVEEWHGIQLAGYDLLDRPRLSRPGATRRRFGLYLAASGRHKLREFVDPNDRVKFLGQLAAYWRDARPLTRKDL